MGKIIYLISFLKNLKIIMFLAIIILLGLGGMLYFIIEDSKDSLKWDLTHNKSFGGSLSKDIELREDEIKKNSKKFRLTIAMLIICILGTIFIPSREEMYMMALVKDYEVQDVYKMSKSELKSSIDYFFEKVDELGK